MAGQNRGLIGITGANGTIGYSTVLYALRSGYRVRCVVRREVAVTQLKCGPSLRHYEKNVEYAVVPDNTIPGAYDRALEGVQYVIHIAGVWPKPDYHPDNEIYHPFVRSMENVLSAASKAESVRRVVFTQAGAALVNPDEGDTLGTGMQELLNEHVRVNPSSAAFRPPLASPHHAYCAAKAYCMTRLQDLREEGRLPFSIVQIIPGTVIGPSELISTASQAYAQMDRMSRALLFNEAKPRYAFGFVHVDDCARVHIEALDESNISEEALPFCLVAAASTEDGKSAQQIWKDTGDSLALDFPTEVKDGLFMIGRANVPINMPYRVNSKWTESKLMRGRTFRGLHECVKDVGRWYLQLIENEKMM